MIALRPPVLARRLLLVAAAIPLFILLAIAANAAETKSETGWHLIRTANPRGGADAVAMMHTADPSKSDIGLAGLMLRCSEKDLEIVIVATTPFAPRSHPRIILSAGKIETAFDATVVSPFSVLLLPPEATALIDGGWQLAPELLIEIDDQQAIIRGVVPLLGLKAAAAMLRTNCPIR
jgi:hypothetical protein